MAHDMCQHIRDHKRGWPGCLGGYWGRGGEGYIAFHKKLGVERGPQGKASAVLIEMLDAADGRAGDMTALGIGAVPGHSFLGAAKTGMRMQGQT